MARISKPSRICMILSIFILVLVSVLCFLLVLTFDQFFNFLIGKKIAILPGSQVYENWKSPSVPIYFSIYVYNITNPNEILNGARPRFAEVGPFVYREDRQKFNIVFSNESSPQTVQFDYRIFYHFVPELSIFPDTQGNITSIDLPTATIAGNVMPFYFWLFYTTSSFKPFIYKTPKEIVWGHEHWFTKSCHGLGQCPTPLAGLMTESNGSKIRNFIIDTGVSNPFNVGKILKYNDLTQLSHWRTPRANMINGTDGSLTRPNINVGSRVRFFVPDFCRSFYADGLKKTTATNNKDVEVILFSSPREQAQSALDNPENIAFCPENLEAKDCPPTGMIPLAPCTGRASPPPVFASQPHFLGADPSIRADLDGIKEPIKKEDATYLLVEPNTGFVLEAYKRVQINIFLNDINNMTVYGNMSKPYYFPLVWFSEIAVADSDALDRLVSAVLRPKRLLPYVLSAFGAVCAILAVLVIAVLVACLRIQKRQEPTKPHLVLADVAKTKDQGQLLLSTTSPVGVEGNHRLTSNTNNNTPFV